MIQQWAEDYNVQALESQLSTSTRTGPREYFAATDEQSRNELVAELIHRGTPPKDVSMREVIIYHQNLGDLIERDSRVVGAGLSGGAK